MRRRKAKAAAAVTVLMATPVVTAKIGSDTSDPPLWAHGAPVRPRVLLEPLLPPTTEPLPPAGPAVPVALTTTTTVPPPPPTVTTLPAGETPGPSDSAWDRLAQCESGGNWHINTGNGYYGGLQFSLESWRAVGGTGYPHQHSRETQIEMAKRLHAQGGWRHWPGCSRKFGWL